MQNWAITDQKLKMKSWDFSSHDYQFRGAPRKEFRGFKKGLA